MAKVYQGERTLLSVLLVPCENLFYRISGVDKDEEIDWQNYAGAMLLFNLLDNGLKYSLSGSTLEIRARLGLSICKGIVEAHGGAIRAENRSGGGLCITILLPL
jgi:hypothetical protein